MAERPNDAARDRLQAVLAAYGADPARWPPGDRELASFLASPNPAVSELLEDARKMDFALAHASFPAAPAGAAARLIARVEGVVLPFAQRSRPLTGQAALPSRLAVLTALAASLALGLYLGASGETDWLTPPGLAQESPEYLSAELAVLDGTLRLFEDNMEP